MSLYEEQITRGQHGRAQREGGQHGINHNNPDGGQQHGLGNSAADRKFKVSREVKINRIW